MKRIAVIGSIYRYLSHVQHIADRFLVGYPVRRHMASARHEDRVAVHRPEARGRSERGTRQGVRLHGLSHHRRGSAVRRRQTGRGCGADHRRARRLSAQREGPDPLSALRVLQAVRRGVREGRPRGSRLQRQASLLELRESEVDGGCVQAAAASRCWRVLRCR